MTKRTKKVQMRKAKALRLRRYKPSASKEIRNPKLISDALLDCIKTEDLASFREVLVAHLMAVNKMAFAKKAGIGRRTLYDLIDLKKEFNPELSTVSAVIRALSA